MDKEINIKILQFYFFLPFDTRHHHTAQNKTLLNENERIKKDH